MPAINSLAIPTTTNVVSPSFNGSSSLLPIENVSNSPRVLLRAEPDNKFAHELAYSAHNKNKTRVKRGGSEDTRSKIYSTDTCNKALKEHNKLSLSFMRIPNPLMVKDDLQEYKKIINSEDCKSVLPTVTTQDPYDSPWLNLNQPYG